MQCSPAAVPLSYHERLVRQLYDKVETVKKLQTHTKAGREAMLPAILDRAFNGEL